MRLLYAEQFLYANEKVYNCGVLFGVLSILAIIVILVFIVIRVLKVAAVVAIAAERRQGMFMDVFGSDPASRTEVHISAS